MYIFDSSEKILTKSKKILHFPNRKVIQFLRMINIFVSHYEINYRLSVTQ